MANVLVEETSLQNIANSIREKTGTTDTYKPSEMATAISRIQSGGSTVPTKGLVIHEYDSDGYITSASVVGMTKIPSYMFYYAFYYSSSSQGYGILGRCTDFTLPDDLTQIESYAFCGCTNLPLTSLPSGIKTIGQEAFRACISLNLENLPSGLTSITGNCFQSCSGLKLTSLPSGIKIIGSGAFRDCSGLKLTSLPSGLTRIDTHAFYSCPRITISSIPSGVTQLYSYSFYNCPGITQLSLEGDITRIETYVFNQCSALEKIIFSNVTSVPTLASVNAFYNTPIKDGAGYIYVPNDLVDSFKSATNWSTYADQIRGFDLTSIECANSNIINTYNNNKTKNIEVTYNGGQSSLCYPEQEGYTLSVSGNATIDGNVLTLTDNAQVGDKITVTVTSTYDTSISSSQEIEVVYTEPSITVNLNDGQWIDSGTTADNGNVIYKSDVGSYNISNGKSTAILTVTGYTSVKLYIRSYAESSYDYTEAFAIDTTATREKGLFTTKGKQSATNYVECVYELDGGTHTIEIMYSKDEAGDKSDDRGYFYIGECS